jgi:23S rRNA (uracil1939-C5)-methyltransferase
MEGENTFTARVESLAAGGAGVLRLNGMAFFMDYCAPGDLVRGRVTESRGRWGRAVLVELLEASAKRTAPLCPLYGRCGGCTLQHVSYQAQLEEKTTMVKDALTRIGGLSWEEFPIVPSSPFEYRNRLRFHAAPGERGEQPAGGAQSAGEAQSAGGERPEGPARPGLMERRTSAVVPLDDCPAADPAIRRALQEGTLVLPPGKNQCTVYARGKTFLMEGGKSRGTVRVAGKDLALDAAFFFQSNGTLLETLIGDLLEAAGGADTTLPAADIFSGVGIFAAFLAPSFPRVDLVEENGAALELARQNVGSPGARFFPQRAHEWARHNRERYGFMVLDPPRAGLSPTLSAFLVQRGPPLIAYVSCSPPSLARDAKLLSRAYSLSSLKIYDFYPQTHHIECLALFTRSGRAS